MDEQRQEIFARLLALAAIREAQVKANPIPFLDELAKENNRLRQAINEALYLLSGASSFDIAQEEIPTVPPSIAETATMRNRKAADVLASALRRSPNGMA